LKVTCAPAGDVMLVQLLKGQPPSNATGPSYICGKDDNTK